METTAEGRLSGSLVVKPGDGSDGATIPVVPGSTLIPPEQLARVRGMKPMQFFPIGTDASNLSSWERTVDAMNAPGVTLLSLDGGGKFMPLSPRYYYGNHVYRLYGLTGATS